MLLLLLWTQAATASLPLPETKRVNSVKSLTNILSDIEKANSDSARFVTLKLQIYIEDLYISQGDAVVLKPVEMAGAIKDMIGKGQTVKQMALAIKRRYDEGEFHEN
jgi:hypothetical protein